MNKRYSINTITNDVMNVSRETFENYIITLKNKHQEVIIQKQEFETNTYNWLLETYYVEKDGQKIIAAQITTTEEKTK